MSVYLCFVFLLFMWLALKTILIFVFSWWPSNDPKTENIRNCNQSLDKIIHVSVFLLPQFSSFLLHCSLSPDICFEDDSYRDHSSQVFVAGWATSSVGHDNCVLTWTIKFTLPVYTVAISISVAAPLGSRWCRIISFDDWCYTRSVSYALEGIVFSHWDSTIFYMSVWKSWLSSLLDDSCGTWHVPIFYWKYHEH